MLFDLRLDSRTLQLVNRPDEDLPAWTLLDYQQCPHCPLSGSEETHCPAAVSLIDLIRRFDNIVSHEVIDLEVITDERKVYEKTTAQLGISSLLGLLLSASGCPHTAYFKPMARFHLPLASPEDTLFRATGMYLLAQYFRKSEGKEVDCELDGLTRIYQDIHQLNISLAKRLKAASNTDSSLNAVIVLDVFTHTLSTAIKDQLEKIRPLFLSYLSDEPVGKRD
ncbi:MAG: hypothetical protein KAS94_04135 [Desulfobulbaceae bacterium]|nr:hypothetical protein [Desulfobulbaceae bacterium]